MYRNGRENAGKQKKNREMLKKCPYPALKSHPAGGQETNLFLRVAFSDISVVEKAK